MQTLTQEELSLARRCVKMAIEAGAGQARVSLSKTVADNYTARDGQLDRIVHSADRSLSLQVFASGKYGIFSTNRLEEDQLRAFASEAVALASALETDGFRKLPEPSRYASSCSEGTEMGLYDGRYGECSGTYRAETVMKGADSRHASTVSEETEYCDSSDDLFICDSNGFEGRHTETSFICSTETTIEDSEGNKYSGFCWEGGPRMEDCNPENTRRMSLEKALKQVGATGIGTGNYTMVLDNNVSSRITMPIISALYGSSIHQKNSFLCDALGKTVFSPHLTIMDTPSAVGQPGARLFDSEGVATKDRAVISRGRVETFFLDTCYAGKLGMEPTVDGPSVLTLEPWAECLKVEEKKVDLQFIMEMCGEGILVTGFNGGNCNRTTGDFSYGVEGFAFSGGRITSPVREMVVTGNIITLWNNVIAIGNDPRKGTTCRIPTLAFRDVSFSGATKEEEEEEFD